MRKNIILIVCLSLALFGSSQPASIECFFSIVPFGILGTVYQCSVYNFVRMVSPDEAYIRSISGEHMLGYNDDNVEAFTLYDYGHGQYFPHGLNKTFKNLLGIQIARVALKEIHQSDLMPFPKLANLYLQENKLEIIEKDLFKFNPNLEYIDLNSNKISHIDPNVFDKLTNLKYLYLQHNTRINMFAENNLTAVKKVIQAVKLQCTDSDYSNLEQKVKSLKSESKTLNSESFNEKIENLENEIKNSKFSNFFQGELHDLKATQYKMPERTISEFPSSVPTNSEDLTTISSTSMMTTSFYLNETTATPETTKSPRTTNSTESKSESKSDSKTSTEMPSQTDSNNVKFDDPKNINNLKDLKNLFESKHIDLKKLTLLETILLLKIEESLAVAEEPYSENFETLSQKIDILEGENEEQNKKLEELEEKVAKVMKILNIDVWD